MAADKTSNSGMLSVGIDLGTSRSAISASNGEQFVVDSFVGWPADLVARKVLQRDLLIGREALDNRTMLDLHRPLERGLLKEGSEKDVEAARELLRHLLSLVNPKNGKGQPVRAVVGVPAAAMRTNKQYLRNALKGRGRQPDDRVRAVRRRLRPQRAAAHDDHRHRRRHHRLLRDEGTLSDRRGSAHADRSPATRSTPSCMKLIQARYPDANFTVFMVREWKEQHSFVGEAPEPVIVSAPVKGVPTRIDITAEMRAACESIVPPIVETMLDLLPRVEPEFQERVRKNIILAGGGGLIRNLGPTLERALEKSRRRLQVKVIEAPVFVGSDGGLALRQRRPETATGTGW